MGNDVSYRRKSQTQSTTLRLTSWQSGGQLLLQGVNSVLRLSDASRELVGDG